MDQLEHIDSQIQDWEKFFKLDNELRSNLNQISEYVGEKLAKGKFGEPIQVEFDNKIFQFVFRVGTSGLRGRVDSYIASSKLLVKPRGFKAQVDFNQNVSLAETIGETARGILYRYYDLIDDEDHVY